MELRLIDEQNINSGTGAPPDRAFGDVGFGKHTHAVNVAVANFGEGVDGVGGCGHGIMANFIGRLLFRLK